MSETTYYKYISNGAHYTDVIAKIANVKHHLWIGTAYVGSANLTGAGLGMKGERNRNFEAGVLTNAPSFVEQAINQFDFVWNGSQCKKCERKRFCPDSPLKY